MEYDRIEVLPEQLLLDPNNYRFHDLAGYQEVKKRSRYKEAGVQQQALKFLTDTAAFDLNSLKDSIRTNGYIPVEQIVVVAYDEDETPPKYLVIEGNRRAACLSLLAKEFAAGAIELSEPVQKSIKQIPVVLLKGQKTEIESYQRMLMAIRHVAGIREWGPYQQAKLVVEMFEEKGSSLGTVAQRIGISSREVARRYRASKALEQMEKDDEFSEFAEPRLYVFFHEAISQPVVREWLGFNNETHKAENQEAARLFFELLSPREVDGERRPPKLANANQQVRQLKDIVSKKYPLEVLSDPQKSFDDAVRAAQADIIEDEEGLVERSIAAAIIALKKPGMAYAQPNERGQELWGELGKLIESIKKLLPYDA